MIYKDILFYKENPNCEFEFCRLCDFYPCELVGEYVQYRKSHFLSSPVAKSMPKSSDNSSGIIEFQGISKVVDECKQKTETTSIIETDPRSIDDSSDVIVLHGTTRIAKESNCKPSAVPVRNQNNLTTNVLSYDHKEWGVQSKTKYNCIMGCRSVYQVDCRNKKVTDGIKDHYKIELTYDLKIKTDVADRWEPSQPVFLSAQTGQGKNYFIENTLLPYVRELNHRNRTKQKVLILSNRLALQRQIKNHLNGNSVSNDEERTIYHYKEFADVMTYQSLLQQDDYLQKLQKNTLSKYIFVICDEAHFFTSDAMFNPHTQKILSAIIRLFKSAIRVYMSATPYDCLEYIIEAEQNLFQSSYKAMVFYHFERNYNYLDVKIYSDIEKELYEEIVRSVNKRKEKWLIFIDDKEKCKTVKEGLENYGAQNRSPIVVNSENSSKEKNEISPKDTNFQSGESENNDQISKKILSVDASTKKNTDYQTLVLSEALPKDIFVLITTSVLDNGVNLTGIKNIVVSDMSKTKVLQMVGRARVKGLDDRKTLYIKRFDEEYVADRIRDFQDQEDAYHSYELAYVGPDKSSTSRGYSEYAFLTKYYNGSIKDWENAKHWFGRPTKEPTKLYLNEMAKSLLEKLVRQYKNIHNEMQNESEQQGKVGQKYLEYQLSWFGKKYCEDEDITYTDKEKAKKTFITFLESYVESGEQIDKDKQKVFFCPEFTKLYDAAFGRKDPNLSRIYSIDRMNKYLKGAAIDYKVVSRSKYWVISRYDWIQEHE